MNSIKKDGVPYYEISSYLNKNSDYCLLIPIINEGDYIHKELLRALEHNIPNIVDIIICDGGSTDGCTETEKLRKLKVNTLLVKRDYGKQGAQLRMGFDFALSREYKGILTIDGNNKDSIESVPLFISKIGEGYDFIQGSRFIQDGRAIRTPLLRYISVRFLHAPIISLTARHWFTDSTNAFRAYSPRYLTHPQVQIFRDIFDSYELLAYLSVRASQLTLKVIEVPVTREYPLNEKTPTKIKGINANFQLLCILFRNLMGYYNPKGVVK